MSHEPEREMCDGAQAGAEPRWVTVTLRLLPVPIYAFAVAAFLAAVAAFCMLFASAERSAAGWTLGAALGLLAVLIGAALVARSRHRAFPTLARYQETRTHATPVVFVLLISIYTWMLLAGLQVFRIFFAPEAGLSWKYYVTLGIAIASTFYLRLRGRSLLAELGPLGGRALRLTAAQAAWIVLFLLGMGAYFAWLMM